MTTEFLQRIRNEFTLTLDRVRETTLAISERVNRKTQVMKLHWQASSLSDRINSVHQDLGRLVCELHTQENDQPTREFDLKDFEVQLKEKSGRARQITQQLAHVDHLGRQLEGESLREDLVALERDLFLRGATIERIQIVPGAAVVGGAISHLNLPPSMRVMAVFRGPALLSPLGTELLRAGDIVMLLGPRHDVRAVRPRFTERPRASA